MRVGQRFAQTVHGILFPPGIRRALWPELALAVLVGLMAVERGPAITLTMAFAVVPALLIFIGPSSVVLTVFVIYMVSAHMYRSFYTLHYGGVVWHLRELLLMVLLTHWAGKLVQGKVRLRYDPAHWAFILLALFILQIAVVGLLREPDPQRIVAELRYPLFLLCYPIFITLVRDRKDIGYYMRVVLGVAALIALLGIFFFCYTFLTGNIINIQDRLGEYVPRIVGSHLVQEVRPSGHMFFEVCAVVLTSLVFCPGIGKSRRLLYAGLLVLFCAAIGITMMRTAYASFAASLVLLLFLATPNRRIQLLTGLLGAAVGLLLLLFLGSTLLVYVNEAMPGMGASIKGRLVEVTGAWHIFLEHPLLGAGVGSRFEGMGFVAKTSTEAYVQTTYSTVHNVWMYYLFKGGTVGMLLTGGALAGLFARGFVLTSQMRDVRDRCLVRGLTAALGGQYIAALAMPRLTYPKGYVFLAMIGCCFVILAEWARGEQQDSEQPCLATQ